jgi:hypothetical protein
MVSPASPHPLSCKVFLELPYYHWEATLVNIFEKQFWLHEKYGFTIEAKTKAILEEDKAQPNKSLMCNLGSVLAT